MIDGWYYLHKNGDLIYKKYKFKPEFDSSFVKGIWPIDIQNRATLWTMLLESAYRGARKERLQEIMQKNNCTVEDCIEYILRTPEPSNEARTGLSVVAYLIFDTTAKTIIDKAEQIGKERAND